MRNCRSVRSLWLASPNGPASSLTSVSNVLVVSKSTRYEVEKFRLGADTDLALDRALRARGSALAPLKARHDVHHRNLDACCALLESRGVTTTRVRSREYKEHWTSDDLKPFTMVFSAGGDGTFIDAASKIAHADLPVLGLNTDPDSGVPAPPDQCLSQFLDGSFRWLRRTRIRVSLSAGPGGPRTLVPHRALNDVFVAESEPHKTTKCRLSADESPYVLYKNSGLIISTGSGSTAWSYNDSKVCSHTVKRILLAANSCATDETSLAKVCAEYNASLVFAPDARLMSFVSRAPIAGHPVHGTAQTLQLWSESWNAQLVVDGALSIPFNDGALATLELDARDDLLTAVLTIPRELELAS